MQSEEPNAVTVDAAYFAGTIGVSNEPGVLQK
jgi:hypothetical protein